MVKPMHEPFSNTSALQCGEILAQKYKIISMLGRGGFAITYKAIEITTNDFVVIKEYFPVESAERANKQVVCPSADGVVADNYNSGLRAFIDEAKTLKQLSHPYIVTVHNYFKENGTAYLVMPFIEGETLEARLCKSPTKALTSAEIHQWLPQLLDALQTIHKDGLLHRDIKPSNILIRKDGNPVLIDFGSARNALAKRTQTLTVALTPGYAPPEQYSSEAINQGPWTDIYALGAVLYRCILGVVPPDSTMRQDASINNEIDPILPSLQLLKKSTDPPLYNAIVKSLYLTRRDRINGIGQFKHELSAKNSQHTDIVSTERGSQGHGAGIYLFIIASIIIIGIFLASRNSLEPSLNSPATPQYNDSIGENQSKGMPEEKQIPPELKNFRKGVVHFNKKEYNIAFRSILSVAESGNSIAENLLGYMFWYGLGVDKNPERAIFWYKQSASKGYRQAQYNLAGKYKNGIDVEKNLKTSLIYYQDAAFAGDSDAALQLSFFAEAGLLGEPKFAKNQARFFYELAILCGNNDALANPYKYLPYDAYQTHKKIDNYTPGDAFFIGIVLFNRKNYLKAFPMLLKAAESNFFVAQYLIGYLLENGLAGKEKIDDARVWYKRAADSGYRDAQYNVARMYEMINDYESAIKYYLNAVFRGDPIAAFQLGRISEKGIPSGGGTDIFVASLWYEVSLMMGNAAAKSDAERCRIKLKR
jgi:serine/threonine protein kinase